MVHIYLKLKLNKMYMFKTVHGNDGKHTVKADFKQVFQTVFQKDIYQSTDI